MTDDDDDDDVQPFHLSLPLPQKHQASQASYCLVIVETRDPPLPSASLVTVATRAGFICYVLRVLRVYGGRPSLSDSSGVARHESASPKHVASTDEDSNEETG